MGTDLRKTRARRKHWFHEPIEPTKLKVGDEVSNLGQIVRLEERGVFVTALLKTYAWSTVDGMRHETYVEKTWHSADGVILEVYRP
jgi:hypothetical protein